MRQVTYERLDRQRAGPLVTVRHLTEAEAPAVRGFLRSRYQ